jgi:hypothetical protein
MIPTRLWGHLRTGKHAIAALQAGSPKVFQVRWTAEGDARMASTFI